MLIDIHISEIDNYVKLAGILEIPPGYLFKIINDPNRYNSFEIHKKNGTTRNIYAPKKELLLLQLKVKKILEQSFNPHHRSYGFVKGKDFISNAENHVRKNFVLNLDLKNFFENISIKRVNNMFQRYFKIKSNIATILSHICCHPDGFLPQGAPTSPIISNIICKSLDKDLMDLAIKCKLTYYSRYADDITFSCKAKKLPIQLAEVVNEIPIISSSLSEIINSHGFEINADKTRLQTKYMHQEVTGITVNKKVNLNRRYIKKIRAILYSFKENSEKQEVPIKLFCEKNGLSDENLEEAKYKIFNIIKGRILHIAHVKSYNDKNFLDFMKKFNELLELYNLTITTIKPLNLANNYFKRNTLVISPVSQKDDPTYFNNHNNNKLESMGYGQGSGFYLKGIGIVTNYHVVSFLIEEIINKNLSFCKEYYLEYFTEIEGKQSKYYSKIVYFDKEKDIAILQPEYLDLLDSGFNYNKRFFLNDSATLLGFPDHNIVGSEVREDSGNIKRKIKNKGFSTYEIDAKVYAGNSGGPVLNYRNEVIGLANMGFTDKGVVPSQFIPIKYVIETFENKTCK